ncbi:MAG TPA: hypothetical protein VH088_17935 [Terriglobales bacterium]|jgi:DNA anti-recombination protein RmuC|nr:hypothetical protein [Terriglobales bacterium]
MDTISKKTDQSPTEHVAAAHKLLKSIEGELAEHPALAEAILKLENVLSLLTLQTKGLL